MPNCFSLTRKSTGQVAILQEVDTEMRKHFKEPPDPDHWLWSWYNTIGLRLALGRTFTDIIQECHSNIIEYPEDKDYYNRKLEIAKYLNQHLVSDAWAEIGKR
jgi:hypothetical protein